MITPGSMILILTPAFAAADRLLILDFRTPRRMRPSFSFHFDGFAKYTGVITLNEP
jgi:hypothetical protein